MLSDIFPLILFIGDRKNYASATLSELLPEDVEAEVKAAAEISMGTEVSEEDICNILHLCTQVSYNHILSSGSLTVLVIDDGDDDFYMYCSPDDSMRVFSHYLI